VRAIRPAVRGGPATWDCFEARLAGRPRAAPVSPARGALRSRREPHPREPHTVRLAPESLGHHSHGSMPPSRAGRASHPRISSASSGWPRSSTRFCQDLEREIQSSCGFDAEAVASRQAQPGPISHPYGLVVKVPGLSFVCAQLGAIRSASRRAATAAHRCSSMAARSASIAAPSCRGSGADTGGSGRGEVDSARGAGASAARSGSGRARAAGPACSNSVSRSCRPQRAVLATRAAVSRMQDTPTADRRTARRRSLRHSGRDLHMA
jgi:hypothetical protein